MQDRATILDRIKQAIREVDPSAELILFGSKAREDDHEESDWDILILCTGDQPTWAHKQILIRKLLNMQLQTGISISAIIRNKDDWQASAQTWFYQEVENDGKILV